MAPILIEVSDDATVLAELLRIGVASLQNQLAANDSPDPLGQSAEVWRGALAAFDAIVPTPDTLELIAANREIARDYAAAFDRYAGDLQDSETAEEGLDEFLAENDRLAEAASDADALLQSQALDELDSRDTRSAAYVAALTREEMASSDLLVEIFTALDRFEIDPLGTVIAMRAPVASLGDLGRVVAELTPPPAAELLHRRHVDLIVDYEATFANLIESVEAGGADISLAVLEDLQTLSAEAPELNVDRTLFMAAVLAGEVI